MRRCNFILLSVFFFVITFTSCKPDLYWCVKRSYDPEPKNTEVEILKKNEAKKRNLEHIATMRISNGALSSVCSYEKNLKYAQNKAREFGGNAIEIIDYDLPNNDFIGLEYRENPCISITFKIFRKTTTSSTDTLKLAERKINSRARIFVYFQKSTFRPGDRSENNLLADIIPIQGEILLDGRPVINLRNNWEFETIDKVDIGEHEVTVRLISWLYSQPIKIDKNKDYYLRVRYTSTGQKMIMEPVSDDIGDFETSLLQSSVW